MAATTQHHPAPPTTAPGVAAALPRRSYRTLPPQQLTERSVRALQAVPGAVLEVPALQYKYLRLRVTPQTRSWSVLRRQRGGKPQRVGLGHWPEVSVSEALDRAQGAAKQLRDGNNPVKLRRAAAAEEARKQLTLRDAVSEYTTRKPLRASTIKSYWSDLNASCPDWLEEPLCSITPTRVAELHRGRAAVSPSRANGVVRLLRAVGRFQNATKKMGLPPLAEEISATKGWAKVEGRTAHLANGTLREWCAAVRALPDDVPSKVEGHNTRELYGSQRDALLVMICTALRLRECLGLRWDEVRLQDRLLVIGADRAKNGREHKLPIGPAITSLLRKRQKQCRSDVYVFPGPDPEKPLDRISRRVFERIKGRDGKVIRFSPHDLRRSALTWLESRDVSAYALKRIANHKDSADVTGGYLQLDVERLRKPLVKLERAVFSTRGAR